MVRLFISSAWSTRLAAVSVVLASGLAVSAAAVGTMAREGLASSSENDAAGALARAWVNGDAQAVSDHLTQAGSGREARLNRAVALLHRAQPAAAEPILLGLLADHPGWVPALRWLGRAQHALGRPEACATAASLTALRGATSRDFLWAGAAYLSLGRRGEARAALAGAVEREPDLYLGWLALGDVHESLGQPAEARAAWKRAAWLCATADVLVRLAKETWLAGRKAEGLGLFRDALGAPGGAAFAEEISRLAPEASAGAPPAPFGHEPARTLHAGEVLRYSAKYLFVGLGNVVLANLGTVETDGRPAYALRLSAQSHPGFFFYRVRNEYNSVVTDAGAVVRHRNFSDDSTSNPRLTSYDMDNEHGVCTWRYAENGLLGFERLPLPSLAQDGVSTLALAREVARTRRSVSVLTAIDGTWKGTDLRVAGVERIRWRGRDVETIRVDIFAHYRGAAGLSGSSSTWFSTDQRALPYRSSFKIPLGSVVLDLESE